MHVERDLQDGKGKVGVDDHVLILQVTNARLKSWVHDEDCLGWNADLSMLNIYSRWG